MNTERETERNNDLEWLRDELKQAGEPALPPTLSAAALFARMDAEDAKTTEEAIPAPEKKQNVIRVQWRRWGSIAAVLVLAVGITYLLQSGALISKDSVANDMAAPEPPENGLCFGADMLPGEDDNRIFSSLESDNSNQKVMENGEEENAPAPNPSTAGANTKDGNSTSGFVPSNENTASKIISAGEQPIPDLNDFDAMAAVSSQLFGSDYEQSYAMFYDSGERWADCALPAKCANYFLLDKTLYGFFPEENRVVNYSGACATVLNEDETAMLSAILQIEYSPKTE